MKKIELIKLINFSKNYPIIQINAALDRLINNNTEYIIDKYNRSGTLINIGDYYMFQPLEINNKNISLFDRTRPINYKRNKLSLSTKNISVYASCHNKKLLNLFVPPVLIKISGSGMP